MTVVRYPLKAANNNEIINYKRDLDYALIGMCKCSLQQIDNFNALGLGEISPIYKNRIIDICYDLSTDMSSDIKALMEKSKLLSDILAEIHLTYFHRFLN